MLTDEDRSPKVLGSAEKLTLVGKHHRLVLEGVRYGYKDWVGSEYSERLASFYSYRGEGTIASLKGGRKQSFLFSVGCDDRQSTLLQSILRTDFWWCGKSLDMTQIVPGKESVLYEHICLKVISDCRECAKNNKVPRGGFGMMSHKELISLGLVFDQNAQSHLPLAG